MIDPFIDAHRVVIYALTEMLLLQLDAARGCEDARFLVDAAIGLIHEVNNAPRDQPARCACCVRRVRRGDHYVGAILPATGDPTLGRGFLVCNECGCMPPRLDAAVVGMVCR
jgi:hypothetical protein